MALVKRDSGAGHTTATAKLVAVVAPPPLPGVAEMCEAVYKRLYARACVLTADLVGQLAAQDAVHDVFTDYLERWPDLTLDERSDAAIMTAILNRAIDVYRRDRRSVELTPELEESGQVPSLPPVEPGVVLWFDDVVDHLVEQLPPQCRES